MQNLNKKITNTYLDLEVDDKVDFSKLEIAQRKVNRFQNTRPNLIAITNQSTESLSSFVTVLNNSFRDRFCYMNYFLYTGSLPENKKLFQHLRSFPIKNISSVKTKKGTFNLQINAHWQGREEEITGWDLVGNNYNSFAKTYPAKLEIGIENVVEANMYVWGFDIVTENRINIMGSLSYPLHNDGEITSLKDVLNRDGWSFPFTDKYLSDKYFMRKIAFWNK